MTDAMLSVYKAAKAEDASIGVTLLSDIRAVFDERKTDTLPSAILAACLCKIEGRAWAEWSHGTGLTANNLARQLKKFKVYPEKFAWGLLRQRKAIAGETLRTFGPGIVLSPLLQPEHRNNPRFCWLKPAFSNRNTLAPVPVAKSASNPHEQRSVPVVPVQNREDAVSEVRI